MMKTKQKLETMITRRLSDAEVQQIEAEKSRREHEATSRSLSNFKPIWRIALTLPHCKVRIIADLRQPVHLGRGSNQDDETAVIDLGLFNAYELGVSRNHAILSLRDSSVYLSDNSSANGTFLNGKLLSATDNSLLHNGDVIQLGNFEMRFDLLFNPYLDEGN